MDDTMIYLTHKKHFEDIVNLSKALIKFGLKILPHKCPFSGVSSPISVSSLS